MTSLTRIAYGSRVRRHGRSRRAVEYHDKRARCTTPRYRPPGQRRRGGAVTRIGREEDGKTLRPADDGPAGGAEAPFASTPAKNDLPGSHSMSIRGRRRRTAHPGPRLHPGPAYARITGPGDHAGRWVVLGFQPRSEIVDAAWLHALAAQHTHERPVILAASTATWLEQAARHLDDAALAGRVDHILADSHQRLSAAFGVLQRDGDCATSAVVIGPDGVVRQISTGARRPLALAA